jgi:hypothetical protein
VFCVFALHMVPYVASCWRHFYACVLAFPSVRISFRSRYISFSARA